MSSWRSYLTGLIGAEISTISRYCDEVIQWRPRSIDTGALLEVIDTPSKRTARELSELNFTPGARSLVLLNATINHDHDISATLGELRAKLNRGSRIALVAYNPYLRGLYSLANKLGIREGELPTTFVTSTTLHNICTLEGLEIVRTRCAAYCPFRLGGLGDLINSLLPAIPLLRWLSFAYIAILRPVAAEQEPPSLSVVIPARNERGNIENALRRMPRLTDKMQEIIFVEGHSNDGTWEEIQRVIPLYSDRFSIKAFQQTGKGKSDAVRLGFKEATGEVLTILDADLTMPPELLNRFFDPYVKGFADFVNGSRLTYEMEGKAMRPLNLLGNILFAKLVSTVLGAPLGDTLCGTKLVSKQDYERMIRWRKDFGDFDPFGDFELLFPAAVLALGIVDVPIRYRDRTYGSTKISRFRHGLMLLRMTIIGFFRIRLGKLK